MIYILIAINCVSTLIIYYLNENISVLYRENAKLTNVIQNLNHEISYLQNKEVETVDIVPTVQTTGVPISIVGLMALAICGLTFLVLSKNDNTVIAELSKNSIKTTGDYIKEVILPGVEILNKGSEARLTANITNVKQIVTETGSVLTNHITEVNKESVLYLVNTMKPPQPITRTLGRISKEILNYIP